MAGNPVRTQSLLVPDTKITKSTALTTNSVSINPVSVSKLTEQPTFSNLQTTSLSSTPVRSSGGGGGGSGGY